MGRAGRDGTTDNRTTPVRIGTDTTERGGAGGDHTIASRTDGGLGAWGANGWDSSATHDDARPARPDRDRRHLASVGAGTGHSAETRADGTLWAWGSNGPARSATAADDRTTPTRIGSVPMGHRRRRVRHTAGIRRTAHVDLGLNLHASSATGRSPTDDPDR